MAVLAVLPVHAIYAGFVLRESLVALTALLAVWTLTEVWNTPPASRRVWAWAALAGLCGGLAILARNTGLALVAAAGLHAVFRLGRGRLGPVLALGGDGAARHSALGRGHRPRVWRAVLYVYQLLRIQLLVDRSPLREGEHAAGPVLHAARTRRRSSG